MTTADLIDALHSQLLSWPLAAQNYKALESCRRKEFNPGGVPLAMQFNPARAVSTAAKVDSASISRRPCFLCRSNRPECQFVVDHIRDWEVLVNPFPIFPAHFTIAHIEHRHQDTIAFCEPAEFVSRFPGTVVFYNGSASGASCPDHLHYQATLQEYLPLCGYLTKTPGKLMAMHHSEKVYLSDATPAPALHIVSRGFSPLAERFTDRVLPPDATGLPDKSRRNVIIWTDAEGLLHTVLFPRSCHRPECYTSSPDDTGENRCMVSPGAVDMAGLVITPRETDFRRLTQFDLSRILAEVAFDPLESPALQYLLLQ